MQINSFGFCFFNLNYNNILVNLIKYKIIMEAKFCINKIVLSNPEEREILWDSKQLDWSTDGELTVTNLLFYDL